MFNEALSAEYSRLVTTILIAALGSAAVRGASAQHDFPLMALRKFYLDASATYVGLALLRTSGLGSWTSLSFDGLSVSVPAALRDLILPISVALLVFAILVARTRWKDEKQALRWDLVATAVVAVAIAVSSAWGTSGATTQDRFDRMGRSLLSAYCGTDAPPSAPTAEPLGTEPSSTARRLPFPDLRLAQVSTEIVPVGRWRRVPVEGAGAAAGSGSDEFCQALSSYLQLRQAQHQ